MESSVLDSMIVQTHWATRSHCIQGKTMTATTFFYHGITCLATSFLDTAPVES